MATVQQARAGIFEVRLVAACGCTGTAEDGDSHCKYQTRQMSFYRCVSGILQVGGRSTEEVAEATQ